MNHHQLALVTVITLIRSIRAASPPCYSPAGQKLPGYGVCDPRLAASVCCGAGDICLSNGLCSNKSNEFYRGGCSDNQYKSGLCPSFCINEPLTAFISVCDRNGGAGGIYLCCDAGRKRGTCCRNETEVFNLAAPFSSITAGPASATNPAVADDEPTSTSSGTLTYILQKTVKANPISTQQASSPPTDPPSPAATAADKPHPLNIGTIAGAATGASLLLLLSLAFLLYCIHRRHHHRRRSHRKRPTIRILKPSDDDDGQQQHELPSSDDPTSRQNSLLFPAELVSKPSRVPVVAELEIKESSSSSSEVSPSSTTAKDPVELSSSSSDQSPRPRGPFELQSREMDIVDDHHNDSAAAAVPAAAITVVPPTPVENEQRQRQHIIIPRSSSHYSRDNTGWEAEEADDDDDGGSSGLQKPPPPPPPPSFFRARSSSSSRPDSLSGPWHDMYDDDDDDEKEKEKKAVFF